MYLFRTGADALPTCIPIPISMSMQPAISTETYREKALRKFKQQPLVPVGTGAFSGSFSFRAH